MLPSVPGDIVVGDFFMAALGRQFKADPGLSCWRRAGQQLILIRSRRRHRSDSSERVSRVLNQVWDR